MLSAILNWIMILLTVIPLGFVFLCLVERFLGYRIKTMSSVLVSGIVLSTVYAEIFSLFYRVNVEALGLLMGSSFLLAFFLRKKLCGFVKDIWSKTALWEKAGMVICFMLWSYFCSRGYLVPDMNLYHGQSIRWIQEYGVVKGLAHIHSRFAYNSAVFALSALFDFHLIPDHSMHAVNGFLAFVLSLELLKIGRCFERKDMLLSDYGRVALFYYMALIWDEVSAPSSDYAVMFILFFLIIKWLSHLESKEKENITPYCLLCVLGVFALSLKLTAGLILILLIKPAVRLLREKKWKEIAIYLGMGILTAAPWMMRTVIICGWLFYPFTAIDLFDVEWKLRNTLLIDMDAKLIAAWARGTRHLGVDIPIRTWYPLWFQNELFNSEKIIIIGDLMACLGTVLLAVWVFLKKLWNKLDELLVLCTLMGCFLFWQVSAPMLRYGYAYVLLLGFVAAGEFFGLLPWRGKMLYVVYAGLLLFCGFKLFIGGKYICETWRQPYYIWQEDYERSEPKEEYRVGDAVLYIMEEGYPPGYYVFPVLADEPGKPELLGDGIRDGFRSGE